MKFRWLAAAAAALAAAVLAAAYLITPGCPLPVFGQGELQIFWNGGGELALAWPDAGEGVEYLVSVRSESQHVEERCKGLYAAFSGFEDGERLHVAVRAVTEGRNLLGMAKQVKSWSTLKASPGPLEGEPLAMEGKPEPGSVLLSWDGAQGKHYEICTLEDGVYRPVASTGGVSLALRFGEADTELPVPSYGKSLQVAVREGISGKGYTLYGLPSNLFTIGRGDLLEERLMLDWKQTDSRVYTLSWTEARGGRYELRQWQDGGWETVLQMNAGAQSLSYNTGRVVSGSLQRYQIVAKDDAGTELAKDEVSFYADISTLYATVWPILDLAYYDAPGASRSLGKIPAGTALCVLEEDGQWFQVRYKDQYVYIDNRFCMINLPEYLGDYCSYDIANSYSSIFKIHDAPIAKVTRQVIPGFEHIQTKDGFLVPYLYPCAAKLLSAAKAVMDDGYHLKIYEAFRPHQATRYLYDTTSPQMELPVLKEDGQGNVTDSLTGNPVNLGTGLMTDAEGNRVARTPPRRETTEETPEEDTPEPAGAPEASPVPETPAAPEVPVDGNPPETETPETQEPLGEEEPQAVLPDMPEGPEDTLPLEPEPEPLSVETLPEQSLLHYAKRHAPSSQDGQGTDSKPAQNQIPAYDTNFKIMTDNGRFGLGSFLAAVTSAHNRGIALDLTIEALDDSVELTMQSAMHDLSWYSATYRNNDNAKLLAKYMTAAGMNGLSSEWWHFQDDDTRKAIQLNTYLEKGVSPAGLVRDDTGWRVRMEDGAFARNTAVTVDGIRYTVNQDGYIVE